MKIGFLNLITLIFIVAKLFGAIDWSWWLVFLPTFVHFGLVIAIIMFSVVIGVVSYWLDK